MRGLGDSTREGDVAAYEKQSLAEDMMALLDELGVDEFIVAGHDWGGPVAQEVALAAEQRVHRLMLLNTPIINNARGIAAALARITAGEGRQHWYQHFQQQRDLPELVIEGKELEWLGHFLRTRQNQPLPDHTIAEYVRCYRIPGTARAGANYYRAMRDDRRRWEALEGHVWPMPALVIHGHRDPTVVFDYLHHAQSCFRDLRLVTIEAGHFVLEEEPDQVAALITDWLGI
jgi:pimeloyl-ACP methyl ester carboxylesterase